MIGSSQILQEHKPTLLLELHTPEQDKLVGSILLKHGYNAYRISTNGYSNEPRLHEVTQIKDLTKLFPEPDGIWGTILAIHNTKDTKSDTLDL